MRSRGDKGEECARAYLVRKGYKIVVNNFCVRGGEIDIIAEAPDGCTVFFEVKLRAREPENHASIVGRLKIMRLWRAIHQFLEVQSCVTRIRLDVLLLIPAAHGAPMARIFWYKNIF